MATAVPAAIWALGITQIVGYGTLYYSFSILAPGIAADFGVAVEWIYGCVSLALLAGGIISPWAGELADRYGAGRIMSIGSVGAAAALAACALANNTLIFLIGLVLVEMVSAFVLYATAFALLAQTTGNRAPRSITHLTLIAGFASTIFWPLTTALLTIMDWHAVYLIFAGLNLGVCFPLHFWLSRQSRTNPGRLIPAGDQAVASTSPTGAVDFALMVLGFSLAGFVSAATLFHMVPLLAALGLGSAGVVVATLLGPAQVASRLINMSMGQRVPATGLAVIAASLMPAALATLAMSAPSPAGAMGFAVIFGMGTGLFSIVSGTLPLALFGPAGFGRRLGVINLGRLALSAAAPFALSVALGTLGPRLSIWLLVATGLTCVGVFGTIWRRHRTRASQ